MFSSIFNKNASSGITHFSQLKFVDFLSPLVESGNIFRLFKDGKAQVSIIEYDEREEGCTTAFMQALSNAIKQLLIDDESLTAEMIEEIHNSAISGIDMRSSSYGHFSYAAHDDYSFRTGEDSPREFGAKNEKVTKEFVEEYADPQRGFANLYGAGVNPLTFSLKVSDPDDPSLDQRRYLFDYSPGNAYEKFSRVLFDKIKTVPEYEGCEIYHEVTLSSRNRRLSSEETRDEAVELINLVIQYFNSTQETIVNDKANLRVFLENLVRMIKTLEMIHPFDDANLRTFVLILMNVLLMKHGLPPATYHDPNLIDMHSVAEFTDFVIQGMLNTLNLIQEPAIELHEVNMDNLSENEKFFIATASEPLNQVLANQVAQDINTRDEELDSLSQELNQALLDDSLQTSCTTSTPGPR